MTTPTTIRVDLVADGRLLWVTTSLDGQRSSSLGGCQRHPWEPDACARRAARLRAAVGRANREGEVDSDRLGEIQRLGAVLFDDLLPRSLKNRLRELEGGYLTLGLTAPLWDVPVELLHDGSDFLALRWAVGRQLLVEDPGARSPARPAAERSRVLVLADPDGSLSECYNEGVVVRQLLGRANRAEVAFHSTRVRRDLVREELRDFDLVHVAGHIDQDGLRVIDGCFTAGDVGALAGGLPMPRLVVLNGCSSGDLSTPGPESLARELLGAGVEHLVGALYEVPDHLARDLAIAFWGELARGVPVGEALRRARRALRDAQGLPTAVWAAYALFGRPEATYPLGLGRADAEVEARDGPVLLDGRADAAELGALGPPVARLRAPGAAVLSRRGWGQTRWPNQASLLLALGLLVGLVALVAPGLFRNNAAEPLRGRVASEPAEVPSVAEGQLSLMLLSEAPPGPDARLQLSLELGAPAFVELLSVADGRVAHLWPDLAEDGWLPEGRHLLPGAGAWLVGGGSSPESLLVVRRTSPDPDPDGLVIYLNALLGTMPETVTHEEAVAMVAAALGREGGVVDRQELP